MRVRVGDVELHFDVEGSKLRPDGKRWRELPTVILLHGGPGIDHSVFKPAYSALADVAQVVFLDMRGHGRSAPSIPEKWRLAVWADDLRELCNVLGIDRPILLGTSFGGFVALTYALRHPSHLSGLILSNTRARTSTAHIVSAFEHLGGAEAGAAAAAFFTRPNATTLSEYARLCVPLYMAADDERSARAISTPQVTLEWFAHEHLSFDLLGALSGIRCPILVLAGDDDPICPIADVEEMVAAMPAHLVEFHRFAGVRHEVARSLGDTYFGILRRFLRKDTGFSI